MTTVLLHGFTGSSAAWTDRIVDGLASRSGALVPVDLPGHGRHAGETDPERFTLDAVFREIDAAAGGEPLDLVGYSMGGRLALAYAVRRPGKVRRLVLESASPGLRTSEERARRREDDEVLARRMEAEPVEAFVDRWQALDLFESQQALPARVRARHRSLRLANEPAGLAASLRGLGTGSLPSFWEDLPALETPTLVLVGALDRKFVEIGRRMAAALPRAELTEVPEAGHTVHLECSGAWLEAVMGFLGR